MKKAIIVTFILCIVSLALADNIRGIDIEFVTIGNAGNPADTLVLSDGTTGYGAVDYEYRIGKYELTNAQWNTFVAVAGTPKGFPINAYDNSAYYDSTQQPVDSVSLYEAFQFCNFLTSGDKSKGVYLFRGNNSNSGDFLGINRNQAKATYGTIYCLPIGDEWYKAAFYKPDGSGYSLCTDGKNTAPVADNGWNYAGGAYSIPWDVGTGIQEQNGTFDMMGNVWEWSENLAFRSAFGAGPYSGSSLFATSILFRTPAFADGGIGFRVSEAVCPSMDLTGDCKVNLADFSLLADQWLTTYDSSDLASMALEWLD